MSNLKQQIAKLSPGKRAILERRLKEKVAQAQLQIQKVDRSGPLTLSFSQQRIWFLDQLESGAPAYNRPCYFRLRGILNIEALTQSLNEIVRRHEVLRSRFPSVKGEPCLDIIPELQLSLTVIDLSQRSRQSEQLQSQEAQQPFDLAEGPLIRSQLLTLSETEHLLLITLHHSVFDGWSEGILKQELATLYGAFSTGQSNPLPALPIQYVDYAHWQRQQLTTSALQSQLAYWKTQLGGELPILQLPTDRPRSLQPSVQGATYFLWLPKTLVAALKTLSQQEGTTLFMTLLTAFKVLLYRYTGQTDVIVGTPVAGRDYIAIEPLIGVFVNTLALRTSVANNPTFQALLTQVRKTVLDAFAHQSVPFEQIVETIQPERNQSQSPVFQVLFQLRNLPHTANKKADEETDFIIEATRTDWQVAPFELTLDLVEGPEGLRCYFQYRTELFDHSTIDRMAGHFQTLLEGIVANPTQTVATLPLLRQQEQHQLLVEWNNTQTAYSRNKCIHQLFEDQVEQTPDAVAVVFGETKLTYRELNLQANQLAHYLQEVGVGPDVLVGICVEPSLEMMVGIFAILKAGGAYVPLDPDYPSERLAYILADTAVSVLLTQQTVLPSLPTHSASTISLDAYPFLPSNYSQENISATVIPANLAYAIYTSGSTGKPKGVLIEHRGLCNLAQAKQSLFELSTQKRCLQSFSLSFDGSVLCIFSTLISGATLYLARKEQLIAGDSLVHWLRDNKINVVVMPPALISSLPPHPLPDLAIIVAGGEVCPTMLVEQWGAKRRFFNAYGPSEATVCTTIAHITDTSASLPIGRPIANMQTYILDTCLHPVPVGVPGELWIGGEGLARGYLNRPELTTERFISSPFSDEPHTRLYKTGDLARYLSDGQIEYLGRIDHQVKLRGFRIELEEIEAVLRQHVQVENACVILREDERGDKRLAAYITKRDKTLHSHQLRQFVRQQLPDYMVPSFFLVLETLPLTHSGKVDRRALPLPDFGQCYFDNAFVEASTPIEKRLCQIWCEVLRIERVGIYDNFFELGGHSLLAVQIITRINESFGLNLSVKNIFEVPTVAEFSKRIITLLEMRSHSNLSLNQAMEEGEL